MSKNLTNKIIDEDLKETGFNMAVAWTIGQITNTISNAFFHFDLNQYNSIKHLVAGVGVGTFAYRKAGGGIKGIIAGLTAVTLCNFAWEAFENGYVFQNTELNIDTLLDISITYAGTILGIAGENLKDYIPKKQRYPKGKEKWVL